MNQEMSSHLPSDQLSVEEMTPPGEIPRQNEDYICSCNGILLWKIDHVKSLFSKNFYFNRVYIDQCLFFFQ